MQSVYTRKAAFWHEVRARTGYENKWLNQFIAHLPQDAKLLDLGCGTGTPIAGAFLDQGFFVTGVDYSPTMIELAKQNFPKGHWVCGDMTDLPPLGQYDGIYSWDGFFHLSVKEQREALPEFAKLIKPGGAILLTVGTGEGEVLGKIDDEDVYHASLSPKEYKEVLQTQGFSQVLYQAHDTEVMGRNILLALNKSG